jgi:2'-5' RNA ligase
MTTIVEQPGGKALEEAVYVYIDLAAREELISIQQQLKESIQGVEGIEWQDPDTFHITLVYVKDISPEGLDRVALPDPTALNIRAGSLSLFNNPTSRALVLAVDHTPELDALQKEIYESFNGFERSDFSRPEVYQPHITLAYLPVTGVDVPMIAFEPVMLLADTFHYARGEYEVVTTVSLTEQPEQDDSMEDEVDMDEDEMTMPDMDEDTGERGLIHQVKDTLTRWFSRDAPPQETRLKVNGNQWVIVWSNNFEDREGEIFTQKAIDDYITRVDTGIVEPPDLWVHHAGPETKIGKAKWVGRHGHFVLAGGTFDDTEKARKARDYYERHAGKTSVSHGFTFPVWGFDGKYYNQFNTFEISLLPRGAEANRYTTLQGVRSMTLDDNKRRYLANVFGEDAADGILNDLDNAGKALEDAQAAFKAFPHAEDDPTPDEGAKDADEGNTPSGSEALLPELVKAQAEVMGMVKDMTQAIGAWRTDVESKMDALEAENKALRNEMALTPPASRSDSTVIPDGEAADEKGKIKDKENSGGDSFWDFARGGNL